MFKRELFSLGRRPLNVNLIYYPLLNQLAQHWATIRWSSSELDLLAISDHMRQPWRYHLGSHSGLLSLLGMKPIHGSGFLGLSNISGTCWSRWFSSYAKSAYKGSDFGRDLHTPNTFPVNISPSWGIFCWDSIRRFYPLLTRNDPFASWSHLQLSSTTLLPRGIWRICPRSYSLNKPSSRLSSRLDLHGEIIVLTVSFSFPIGVEERICGSAGLGNQVLPHILTFWFDPDLHLIPFCSRSRDLHNLLQV